jgi:hypothetical protein
MVKSCTKRRHHPRVLIHSICRIRVKQQLIPLGDSNDWNSAISINIYDIYRADSDSECLGAVTGKN